MHKYNIYTHIWNNNIWIIIIIIIAHPDHGRPYVRTTLALVERGQSPRRKHWGGVLLVVCARVLFFFFLFFNIYISHKIRKNNDSNDKNNNNNNNKNSASVFDIVRRYIYSSFPSFERIIHPNRGTLALSLYRPFLPPKKPLPLPRIAIYTPPHPPQTLSRHNTHINKNERCTAS